MHFLGNLQSCLQRHLSDLARYLKSTDHPASVDRRSGFGGCDSSASWSTNSSDNAPTSPAKRPPLRRCKRRTPAPATARILQLARPKQCTPRFAASPIAGPAVRHVRIDTHHIDPPISSRLRQLALPSVRYLRSARQSLRDTLGPKRTGNLNMHLQQSLFTLYTRLANVPMPP